MEEARIEFARLRGRCRHLHGILTAAEHDMLVRRTDCRRIHRPFGFVRLQAAQRLGIEQLRGVILGGGHEHGAVLAHLHVIDDAGMVLDGVQLFAGAQIEDAHRAVLVTGDDGRVQAAPQHRRDLGRRNRNAQNWLRIRERFVYVAHIDDDALAALAHRAIGRVGGLIARKTKVARTYRRFAHNCRNRFADLDVPDSVIAK